MKTLKLFFSFCFLASSAFAGFIDGSRISYGNWTGGAYFSEETGLFSHCAVSARYLTGNTLFFSLTREYSLNVGVQIQEPLFKDYREFQTTVKIDKFDAVFSNATVLRFLAFFDLFLFSTPLFPCDRATFKFQQK